MHAAWSNPAENRNCDRILQCLATECSAEVAPDIPVKNPSCACLTTLRSLQRNPLAVFLAVQQFERMHMNNLAGGNSSTEMVPIGTFMHGVDGIFGGVAAAKKTETIAPFRRR